MNKNVFIVCAYPNTPKKIEILKDCLKSLKSKENYDIILTTNYKITDTEIYDLVDYFIFDKTDIKSWIDLGVDNLDTGWYMNTNEFRVSSMFDNAYHYDIYRSTYNAIGLANSLKYNFFTYIEGDCILKDFKKLELLNKRMISEDKKLFFGRISMSEGYDDYCTLLYGGSPSFYLDHVNISYDPSDWMIIGNIKIGLEIIIYNSFKKYSDTYVLELEFHSEMENILEYNRIKKISEYGLNNIFYYDSTKPNCLYIFLHNNTNETYNTKFYFDDDINFEQEFKPFEWILKEYLITDIINKKAKFIINIGNELNDIVEKDLTSQNIERLKKTHIFTWL